MWNVAGSNSRKGWKSPCVGCDSARGPVFLLKTAFSVHEQGKMNTLLIRMGYLGWVGLIKVVNLSISACEVVLQLQFLHL